MNYIFSVLIMLFMYALYEYRNIAKTFLNETHFNIQKKQNIKIIYLTDFQYDLGNYIFQHSLMKKIIKMINEEKPDLVLLGGDYIHHNVKYYHIFDYLKEINFPKIGILGNHDYKDIERVKNGCHDAGIKLLINESIRFKDIDITGLDNLREGHPKMPKINPDVFNILLIHEPDDFENYIDKYHFDMTLAGHLHGGQINLFGMYAPILPSRYGQRYVYGLVERKGQRIFVSRGLGGYVFFFPLRFFARPEIVILDI